MAEQMVAGLYHPLGHRFAEYIRAARDGGYDLARPHELRMLPGIIVTGCGPSLTRYGVLDEIRMRSKRGYAVMACKESGAILRSKGIRVDFAVATDPKPDQIGKTQFDPNTTYYFSSLCHPDFLTYFRGAGARIRIFHVSTPLFDPVFPSAEELILSLWGNQPMVLATGGVSVASRALGLANALAPNAHIVAAGMDFGWRGSSYYARGATGTAGNWGPVYTDRGALDGVPWFSKHDQLICAEHLARSMLVQGPRLRVLGDSIAIGFVRRHQPELQRYGACWGRSFKRVDDPTIPAGGAGTVHQMISREEVEVALSRGYPVPRDVLEAAECLR